MADRCLACDNDTVEEIFAFAHYPVFLGAVPATAKLAEFPLHIGRCTTCTHVQQISLLPAEQRRVWYEQEYYSCPSPSQTGIGVSEIEKCRDFFRAVELPPGPVLEIGCFDGYFLSLLQQDGREVFGCEPSYAAAIATAKYGFPIENKYFSRGTYGDRKFSVVVLRNILEHIDALDGFMRAVADALTEDGVIIIEVPNAHTLLAGGILGTFFHQHVSYFSPESLACLLRRYGLTVSDERTISYAYYACARRGAAAAAPRVDRDLMETELQRYFSERERLRRGINELLRQDKRFALFGAGGHSTGLVCLLAPGLMAKIVRVYDNDPLKHGKLLAGYGKEIVASWHLLYDDIDTVVVSSYLYQDVLCRQILDMQLDGISVIALYPEVRAVSV